VSIIVLSALMNVGGGRRRRRFRRLHRVLPKLALDLPLKRSLRPACTGSSLTA
jgi:hypothetical protein